MENPPEKKEKKLYTIYYKAHGYRLSLSESFNDVNVAKNQAEKLFQEGFNCNYCGKKHSPTQVTVEDGARGYYTHKKGEKPSKW